MTTTQFAVYTDQAILAVGATAEAAVAESGVDAPIVSMNISDNYRGGIVDFRDSWKVRADSEAVSGADAKLRRCSAALASLVAGNGGDVVFAVRDDGVLDIRGEE